jgi:hypothetical protein
MSCGEKNSGRLGLGNEYLNRFFYLFDLFFIYFLNH